MVNKKMFTNHNQR